jgi:hypothetical protein
MKRVKVYACVLSLRGIHNIDFKAAIPAHRPGRGGTPV